MGVGDGLGEVVVLELGDGEGLPDGLAVDGEGDGVGVGVPASEGADAS